MRLAFFLLSCCAMLAACNGDRESNEPPELRRSCGELDGVEPVEPALIEEDPPSFGLEGGCPAFEPVPCTSPIDEYDALCGPGCRPATATNENGDEWLIGCEYSLMTPCADLEYVGKTECFRDPFNGDEYWYTYRDCSAVLVAIFCWTWCDPDRNWDAPIDWSLSCPPNWN